MGSKAVSVHEAKTHLSRLLMDVASGQEITIERSGKPVARLVPIAPTMSARKPGYDVVVLADDFDTLPKSLRKSLGMK